MFRRREFLRTAGIVLAAQSVFRSEVIALPAEDVEIEGSLPPLPDDLAASANLSPAPYVDTALVGTATPKPEEINIAHAILENAPFSTKPVSIAEYFYNVGAGNVSDADVGHAGYGDIRKFVREWPIRANPLIFHFFSSTQTKPEGDTTAWCAAFVNWCLLRANSVKKEQTGKAPGSFSVSGEDFPTAAWQHSSKSASSGSFRCWQETTQPVYGDIAVFKDAGTDSSTPHCLGQGHVAFYLKDLGSNKIKVLGGNQTLSGSNGAVTMAKMSTASGSRFMKIVSLK